MYHIFIYPAEKKPLRISGMMQPQFYTGINT